MITTLNNSYGWTSYSPYGGSHLGMQHTKHLSEMLTTLDSSWSI